MWPNIEGPHYFNHDFSVFKNFPIGGNKKFQFRAVGLQRVQPPAARVRRPKNLT